jgi:LPXTG-motif cell wall-anchored protein
MITLFLLQIPRNIPNPTKNEPLVLDTPFDYFLVIGMPLLILAVFFYLRKRKKNEAGEQ